MCIFIIRRYVQLCITLTHVCLRYIRVATLNLDFPMIIFCDQTTHDRLCQVRMGKPTRFVVRPLTDYDFFKAHYQTVRSNRQGDSKYHNSRNTTSYCLLTMLKIAFLNEAMIPGSL